MQKKPRQSEPAAESVRWNHWTLFFSLMLLYVLTAVFGHTPWGGLLMQVLYLGILISGIRAAAARGWSLALALFLAVASTACLAAVLWTPVEHEMFRPLLVASLSALLLFQILTAAVILHTLLRSRRVTMDTVLGAVNVYVLLGLIWAFAFTLIGIADPLAFSQGQTAQAVPTVRRLFNMAYLSYVTLCTLGYGDLVPVSPIARALATVEAMVGQIYMAVLVARLVALQIGQSIAAGTARPSPS